MPYIIHNPTGLDINVRCSCCRRAHPYSTYLVLVDPDKQSYYSYLTCPICRSISRNNYRKKHKDIIHISLEDKQPPSLTLKF